MLKTYKYKLNLTKSQSTLIDNWIGVCRFVYNLAKETKRDAYRKGVNLGRFELIKQLTQLREDIEWINSVPIHTLQNVIERLDRTYKKYFTERKNGVLAKLKSTYIANRLKKGLPVNKKRLADFGKPKWAMKDKYNSITFKFQNSRPAKYSNNSFFLHKIGEVKVYKDRMPDGKIKIASIKKEHDGYYLFVVFESESRNLYPTSESQAVGIDMGITYFAVDSNGKFTDNPRYTKKYEDRLRVKNRELSRKIKDSHGFKRVKMEINKLHHKIASIRKDFLHKASTEYVRSNSIIVCEDLNVSGMIKNKNLSKHISDASWSAFFGMMKYKSEWYEKEFIQVNPKYTSQKCSCCGHIAKENRLTQSKFECVKCGHTENADFQASKVILSEGLKTSKLQLGEGIALKHQREAVVCA